jgi:hypothetical protein
MWFAVLNRMGQESLTQKTAFKQICEQGEQENYSLPGKSVPGPGNTNANFLSWNLVCDFRTYS